MFKDVSIIKHKTIILTKIPLLKTPNPNPQPNLTPIPNPNSAKLANNPKIKNRPLQYVKRTIKKIININNRVEK